MGNIHLVTGCAGAEHITSADQGAFNAALIGTGQFVLEKGNSLSVQVISNNQIRVLDGELMMQGRFVRLEPGTYVDLAIENGEQGKLRNDLIAARYTKDASTGFESVDLVVIKGTAAASNPADPAHTEGDITDGAAILHEFPLWRIPLEGLNIGTPVALFGEPFVDSLRTLPGIRQSVETIHKEVDDQLADYDVQMAEKIAAIESYTKEETLTEETKALVGLAASAVPDEAFALLAIRKGAMEIGSYVGTGVGGSAENATVLNFNFDPTFVIIFKKGTSPFSMVYGSGAYNHLTGYYDHCKMAMISRFSPTTEFVSYAASYNNVNVYTNAASFYRNYIWGEKSLSFYSSYTKQYSGLSNDYTLQVQLNESGVEYIYLAIGVEGGTEL